MPRLLVEETTSRRQGTMRDSADQMMQTKQPARETKGHQKNSKNKADPTKAKKRKVKKCGTVIYFAYVKGWRYQQSDNSFHILLRQTTQRNPDRNANASQRNPYRYASPPPTREPSPNAQSQPRTERCEKIVHPTWNLKQIAQNRKNTLQNWIFRNNQL